ncbi:MAG: cytochrome c biogenesis protein ResB [Pyrinomonadaceae bacterium]
MTRLEETEVLPASPAAMPTYKASSLINAGIRFVSSVRLGVGLLITLGAACVIGMLIMQQNVAGFANYFAALTPAQRLVYGRLGFFDIYHAWYFNALLCALSLNIILSTVDRLPRIWPYVSKPSFTVPVRWLREQRDSATMFTDRMVAEAASDLADSFKSQGLRRITIKEKNGRTFVYGEKGVWNRLAFVAVHIALLTIFLGGFLTAQLGQTGNLPLAPGQSSDLIFDTAFDLDKVTEVTKRLPFEVTFTDIQQKLIRDDGSLSPSNTIDWMTWFTIKDETGIHNGFVQMNRPFDYRGYRFFQASFTPVGRARSVSIVATPVSGGAGESVTIERGGTATLADGTKLVLRDFRANFRIGPEDPNEDTSRYENPAAILEVLPSGEVMQQATVFGPEVGNIPIANKPVGGYTFKMSAYEKVADSHVLSVQRDPGSSVVYVGFSLLFLTLVGVFSFSHKRLWAVIEDGGDGPTKIVIAGHSNRNPNGFGEYFERFLARIRSGLSA